MKLGLYGGTFNPIHLGHLKAAEEIIASVGLDKICFVPSNIPPHKYHNSLIAGIHRFNMIKLCIKDNNKFCVSDFEISRQDVSYTINTLRYFSNTYREADLYFIVGNDIFNEIETWKNYKSLFDLGNFIVIIRPGFTEDIDFLPVALDKVFRYYEGDSDKIIYKNKSSKMLIKLRINGFKISSSEIRNLVIDSKPIKNLVPLPVEKYILRNNLYNQGVHR